MPEPRIPSREERDADREDYRYTCTRRRGEEFQTVRELGRRVSDQPHVARCMSTANPGHLTSACRLHAGASAQASKASPSREFTTHALLVGGEGSGLGAQGLQSMSFAGLVDAAWLRSIKASHLMRAITRDHTSVTPLPGTRDR
jgi:hypothetical protein